MPSINVPQNYINMFDENMKREDAEKIGIDIAVEIAGKLIDYVDGFYFITPFNRINMIMKVMDRLGI